MGESATELLQRLIRFDTVNPPGDEQAAQEHVAGLLRDAGFDDVQLLAAVPGRPNLVARLRGRADGPVLCLLSHMDTVLARASEWRHDPWSGDIDADGMLWGRGALDMKSQTAAEVAAAISLAREGWRPARGDLLVVCVVDEEVGGALGAQWICREHPDLVRADFLLNEGAGPVVPFEGRRHHGVCVAEKGVFRFTLRTRGAAGHASIPKIGDNALLKLAPLLERMRERRPGFDLTPGPQGTLEGLGLSLEDGPEAALAQLEARDPALARLVEPMLHVTLAPTMAGGSDKLNVIPSQAWIKVDCRVPPGLDRDRVVPRIEEVLGTEGYDLEFFEEVVGNGSPVESPLMDAIRGWLAAEDPETTAIPTILPGFTDSRTWRDAFPECVAYGFFPHRHQTLLETAPLIHAPDERIDVRDLAFATRFYRHVCQELLG